MELIRTDETAFGTGFPEAASLYVRLAERNPRWTLDHGTVHGTRWVGLFSPTFRIDGELGTVAVIQTDQSGSPVTVIDPDRPRRNTRGILAFLRRSGFGVPSTGGDGWSKRSLVMGSPLSGTELQRLERTISKVAEWSEGVSENESMELSETVELLRSVPKRR